MDKNRKTAYQVLLEIEKNEAYSNLALNDYIGRNQPDSPAFVREIVYGVLKNKLLLDYYLDALVATGTKKMKARELTLLRMGVYQIKFMNSVPDYAAINETVNLAKAVARGREGFINGVLRNFSKTGDTIALPDVEQDPMKYYTVKYSASPWVVKTWRKAYGDEMAEKLLEASFETPELCLRTNITKTTREELMEELTEAGFKVRASERTDRGIIAEGTGLLDTAAFAEGKFSVQDEASLLAADAVGVQPGETVIDVCAAPGGKTFAMAERMENQGKIYAMDLYEHKLELMEAQARRAGLDIVTTRCHDSTQYIEEWEAMADRVLADVPCTGAGVFRRKPEIKYRWPMEIQELLKRQQKILFTAAGYVKPGGTLVYSTCTINPDENEKQIEQFLKTEYDFKVVEQTQLLPTDGIDGFFICKMIRER